MELAQLKKQINQYMNNPDLKIVDRAYKYAEEAHLGQYRVSGEPFVEHPLGVALILSELELDIISIVGALLHDVVEDTHINSEDIAKEFSQEVALLVDGVTKLTRLKFKTKEEQQ